MKKAVFYHAGCPVCIEAEQSLATALDPTQYTVNIVHLGEEKEKISEAEDAGIKSVPALLVDGNPFHINFGASLSDLK
jgi:glutaredoxin